MKITLLRRYVLSNKNCNVLVINLKKKNIILKNCSYFCMCLKKKVKAIICFFRKTEREYRKINTDDARNAARRLLCFSVVSRSTRAPAHVSSSALSHISHMSCARRGAGAPLRRFRAFFCK